MEHVGVLVAFPPGSSIEVDVTFFAADIRAVS